MHKIIYISFLCLSFLFAVRSQGQVQAPAEDSTIQFSTYQEENLDTSLHSNDLAFPADSIQQWKKLKDFAYIKNLDSLLKEKQKEEVNIKPRSTPQTGFLNNFFSSTFIRVLLWSLAIAFILFILYRLFLAEGVFRRESKNTKANLPEVAEEVITAESDFDNLISQALQQHNYRQAIRYQYLRTLHKLAGKNFIELAPDKTNYQYVREIKNPAFQNDFASLTLNYEYVWYGEFMIERNIYQKLEMNFTELNQKL